MKDTKQAFATFIRPGLIACVVPLLVSACARFEERTGYIPDDSALATIVVGRDTQETVPVIIGRPSAEGVLNDNGWFYVRSDYERFLWRERKEVNREVVVVTFNDAGIVSNVERFGLEQGQIVVLNRRTTASNIEGVSILQQLFGNIGNFGAGDFLPGG